MTQEAAVTAYLALGSNLGDRLENLRAAARRLEAAGVRVAARSRIYETQSVEGGGPGDFLNAALRVETQLSARELLALLNRIEAEIGRAPTAPGQHRGGSRPIDIDILLFGEEEHSGADLTIPHPRLGRRAFVLRPLLDVLEGGWVRDSGLDW